MTPRTIPDSAVVVAAGDLLSSEFDRELVILNLRDGVYYGLEDAGARIWALVTQRTTFSAIVQSLVSEYDVERERCERDLQALLQDLVSRGLVEIRESAKP